MNENKANALDVFNASVPQEGQIGFGIFTNPDSTTPSPEPQTSDSSFPGEQSQPTEQSAHSIVQEKQTSQQSQPEGNAQQTSTQLSETVIAAPEIDMFEQMKKDAENKQLQAVFEKPVVMSYPPVNDEITEDTTFEALRQKYAADFPELDDKNKVSWSMTYGKVVKAVSKPEEQTVYTLKAEIEASEEFRTGILKAKKDADKNPKCVVKPQVRAQKKGELKINSYKGISMSRDEVKTSKTPILVLPSKDGGIYEKRESPIGTFIAQCEEIPFLPLWREGFTMKLPKIPAHILEQIISFFSTYARHKNEVLAHIIYDTENNEYRVNIPAQSVNGASVSSVLHEYPETDIHVMDIHSHHVMDAFFSSTDNADEKATRLYAVVGRLDKVVPEIAVRASCGGKFIDVDIAEIFEAHLPAPDYPNEWDSCVQVARKPKPHVVSSFPGSEVNGNQ